MKKTILIAILLITYNLSSFSQVQNPPNIKWKQITATHANIIFPQEIEGEAQRVANMIDYLYEYQTQSLNTKPKKVPILLFNQSTVPNGFAGLRPRRSVWFTTPSQYATDLSNYDWLMLMSVHEFRHIVQYSKLNTGFTKFMSVVLGQTGLLMGEYSVPYWFFEGDAISAETGFSQFGRGRIPQFEMAVRTMLLNDKKVSYNKAKFRSYKDFFPSHYNLGWMLISHGREKYGKDFWDKVTGHTSKISFWPYAFSLGIKKYSGKNEKKFYDEAMTEIGNKWKKEESEINIKPAKIITKSKKKTWTKYTETHLLDNGNVFAIKGDLKNISAFYEIYPDGTEKKIKNTIAQMISVVKNKVIWAEYIPDERWAFKSFSDIKIFDINTKKEKRLTHNKKLFAPALSPDTKKIAVVEFPDNLKCSLIIIDSETGKEIKRFENKNNDFIRTPAWSEDGKKIVYTNSKYSGAALTVIDYETGEINEILPYSFENIGRPVFYKNYILYNSPYSGIGNIYAIDINTKKKFQITSRKYGAYNPKVKNDKMLFIDYGKDGYDIAEISLSENNWTEIQKIQEYKFNRAEAVYKQEQNKNLFDRDKIPDKKYEVSKYKKIKHGINIHSWGPNVDDESNVDFSLSSGNVLNTVFGIVGAKYNILEETAKTYLTTRFAKYYPIFDITGSYGSRYTDYKTDDNLTDRWNEIKGGFSMSVPLNFSRGIYISGMNIKTKYEYTQTYGKDLKYPWELVDGGFSSLNYNVSLYSLRSTALRDINPGLGAFLFASYTNTPFNEKLNGKKLSGLATIYLPGIFKNHSLVLKTGYEIQENFDINQPSSYYWFSSSQFFTRGYKTFAFQEIINASVNYEFPLWYPEFGIGSIVYFKRLSANIFYDYSKVLPLGLKTYENLQSFGIEISLELRVFRNDFPIEIGGRFSYLPDVPNSDGKQFVPEFLVFGIPLNFQFVLAKNPLVFWISIILLKKPLD